MKVTKEIKNELDKIPAIMLSIAKSALQLANDCTSLSEKFKACIDELEVEPEHDGI